MIKAGRLDVIALGLVAVLAGTCLILRAWGGSRVAIVGTVLAATVYLPAPLLAIGTDYTHVGIASGVPVLYTYSAVVAAAALVLAFRWQLRIAASHLFLLVGLLSVGAIAWEFTPVVQAGVLHLVVGVLAFSVGRSVPSAFGSASPRSARALALVLLMVVASQLAIQLLQVMGFELNIMGMDLVPPMQNSRPSGSFAHPSSIGKVLLLMLPVLLPLMRSIEPVARRRAVAAVVLAVIVTGMSQSRANTIAVLAAVVFWFYFSKRMASLAQRIGVLVALGLAAVLLLGALVARFAEDPDGGDRPELLTAGLTTIRQVPLTGVGPNSYIDVVGYWDAVTASGYPVHNTFLLAAAEVGVVLAALLFIPVILPMLRAGLRWIRRAVVNAEEFALVAIAPGFALIAWTGWGLLNREMLVVFLFFTGLAVAEASQVRPRLRDRPRQAGQKRSLGYRNRVSEGSEPSGSASLTSTSVARNPSDSSYRRRAF